MGGARQGKLSLTIGGVILSSNLAEPLTHQPIQQQPSKVILDCDAQNYLIKLVKSLFYSTNMMFSICNKNTSVRNVCVASPGHALVSNQSTQVLSTCRGSQLCTWFGGPKVIVAMVVIIVAV